MGRSGWQRAWSLAAGLGVFSCAHEEGSPTPSESSTSGGAQTDATTGQSTPPDDPPPTSQTSTGEPGSETAGTSSGSSGPDSTGSETTNEPPVAVDCEAIAGPGTSFYEDNVVLPDPGPGPTLFESTPRAEGMDPALLSAASTELARQPALLSFIVVRNNAIVWEDYFNGSSQQDANNIHSASKSIVSSLIGIAIERGDIDGIDQPLSELLPNYFADIDDPQKLSLTVEHLLTMSGGLAWEEDATEYDIDDEPDWVGAILDLPISTPPGEAFNYSTAMTHLASAVLTETTGMSTCAFAHAHLLGPLGIEVERWGRDPQGYFSGGYNVFMTAREMAAFGMLHSAGGEWNGEQLVPRAWTAAAAQLHFPEYGYLWWLLRAGGHDVQTAWGYGGQLIYVIRSLDLVVVMSTNTQGKDPDFDGLSILDDYVIPATN